MCKLHFIMMFIKNGVSQSVRVDNENDLCFSSEKIIMNLNIEPIRFNSQ